MVAGVAMTVNGAADLAKGNGCDGKLSLPCVFQVYDSIFKTGTVTEHCCEQLINMGDVCHYGYVTLSILKGDNKGKDPSEIINKATQVWNQCASTATSPSA